MTSHHDQPRLMLLGATGVAADAPGKVNQPAPGRVRRAVSFVWLSMRTQPLVTLATALLCLAIGITHLWATQPYWILEPEYRIGSLENDPAASPLRVEVAPGELRDLLISDSVVRGAALKIETDAPVTSTDWPASISATRRAAIGVWRYVEAVPARVAAALGLRQSGIESSENWWRVTAPKPDPNDRVVQLEVAASSPEAAERMPALLLDEVRKLLLREERSRTLGRVEELRPLRDEAASRARAASAAVAQYRLEIGRHDPESSAQEIQSRLVKTRGDRAGLETDLREAEANRLDIATKLANATIEQTTRVVVEQNRRIQDLKNEIGALESQYAADLAVKTVKHQDMVRLRLEIESKKRDLNNEELLVIREKVQEPSMEYVGLLERQAQNNRQLVTLAGRELGLAETEEQLQSQLVEAMQTAQRMEDLVVARNSAAATLQTLDDELVQLEARLTSVVPFSQITLVGRPTVADPSRPDEPDATFHLLTSALAACVFAVLIPVVRGLWRSRLIAPWQVEQLASALPVQLVGELPGRTQRLLARLPGGDGR